MTAQSNVETVARLFPNGGQLAQRILDDLRIRESMTRSELADYEAIHKRIKTDTLLTDSIPQQNAVIGNTTITQWGASNIPLPAAIPNTWNPSHSNQQSQPVPQLRPRTNPYAAHQPSIIQAPPQPTQQPPPLSSSLFLQGSVGHQTQPGLGLLPGDPLGDLRQYSRLSAPSR